MSTCVAVASHCGNPDRAATQAAPTLIPRGCWSRYVCQHVCQWQATAVTQTGQPHNSPLASLPDPCPTRVVGVLTGQRLRKAVRCACWLALQRRMARMCFPKHSAVASPGSASRVGFQGGSHSFRVCAASPLQTNQDEPTHFRVTSGPRGAALVPHCVSCGPGLARCVMVRGYLLNWGHLLWGGICPPPHGTELQGMQGTCPCALLAVLQSLATWDHLQHEYMGPGGDVGCLEAAMGGVHHTHGDQEGTRIHIHTWWEGMVVCLQTGKGDGQQWCTASRVPVGAPVGVGVAEASGVPTCIKGCCCPQRASVQTPHVWRGRFSVC